MSKKTKNQPGSLLEPLENFRPAKGVLIRSGARRGATVYGIPEYAVRIGEDFGDFMNAGLERAMATPEVQRATQGRTPAEIQRIRGAIFSRLYKEIEPTLHALMLHASLREDHGRFIDDFLDATLGRRRIEELGREVVLEKAWEALEPKSGEVAPALRPSVRNPVHYLQSIVGREGLRHHILSGKSKRMKANPDYREHTLGTKDRVELEVDHHAAERLEKGKPWRRRRRVGFDEANLKNTPVEDLEPAESWVNHEVVGEAEASLKHDPVVFGELESKELLETLMQFYESEASAEDRELLEALFEHGTPAEALRAIGDEGKMSRWQALQRKLERRDPRN